MERRPATSALPREIKAFEAMKVSLEEQHSGKWVLIVGEELIGRYDSFQDAAMDATSQFGRGPYLVRQVSGALRNRLSSAAVFGREYAHG